MSNSNRTIELKTATGWMRQVLAIGMLLSLGIVSGVGAEEKPDLAKLVGQPAELSAWAYAYRADLNVQEKPEACFVLRRLERLDRAYRPVSLLLSQGNEKTGTPWPKLESDWQLLSKEGCLGARQDVAGAERRSEIRVALGRTHAFESPGTPLAEKRSDGAAAAKRRTSRVSLMVRLVRLAIGSAGDGQARNLRGRFDLGL